MYETSSVTRLVIADNYEQAFKFASTKGWAIHTWLFVQEPNVLCTFPIASVFCIEAELYRPDLERIRDICAYTSRLVHYDGDDD